MTKLQKQSVWFTQVANKVLYDKRLSAKAKWIYAYLYSKPDNWQFAYNRIAHEFSDGEKSILSGLKELEFFWYLERKKQGNGSVDYFLYIDPTAQNRNLGTDPTAENGYLPFGLLAEKGSISNTDITNNTKIYSNTEINEQFSKNPSLNSGIENHEITTKSDNWDSHNNSADSVDVTKPKIGQATEAEKITRKTSIASQKRNLENEKRAKMLAFLKKTVGCDKFKDFNEWTEVGKMLTLAENLGQEQFLFRLKTILEDSFKAKNSNKLSYLRKEIESFIHSPAVVQTQKFSIWQA